MSDVSSRARRSYLRAFVLLTMLAAPAPLTADQSPIERLGVWIHAVEQHEAGMADDYLREVGSWSRADLTRLVPYFNAFFDVLAPGPEGVRRGIPDTEMELVRTLALRHGRGRVAQVAKRAALLHSDIAIAGVADRPGEPPPPVRAVDRRSSGALPERRYALERDGEYGGAGIGGVHWDLARLMLRVLRTPPPDPDAVLWYIAAGAHLMAQGNIADALPHFEDALDRFPSEPRVLFAAGCVFEALAGDRVQRVAQASAVPGRLELSVGSRASNLARAAALFRRTIEADSAMTEAKIRLAFVLRQQGRDGEAMPLLRSIDAVGLSPTVAYYRALFLGDVEQASGDAQAARAAYRDAAALFPAAQSPKLALAVLDLVLGLGEDPSIVTVLSTSRIVTLDPADPWWVYRLGDGRDAPRLVAAMRRALSREAP